MLDVGIPLAQLGPADEWMPFVIGVIVFMIPIIAILTSHQQRMAKIMREGHSQSNSDEIATLRAEVAKLTQAVHQNTIAIDNLSGRQQLPPAAPPQADSMHQYLQGR